MKLTYFAQAKGPAGLIKIGSAYQVRRRMRELKRTVPGARLLAATDAVSPAEARQKFRRSRAFKDWHQPTPDLLQLVERLEPDTNKLIRQQAKEGLSRFGEWCKERKITYADAARALDITRAYACMLGSGRATVSTKLGFRIMTWIKTLDPSGDFQHEDLADD